MKKMIALICAAVLMLGMTACTTAQNNDPNNANNQNDG